MRMLEQARHFPIVLALLLASCARETPAIERARERAHARLAPRFDDAHVAFPPRRVHVRVFKRERVLELWASAHEAGALTLVHRYRVCRMSGGVGPKRQRGDRQVPEGFYVIDRFHDRSRHLVSLGLSYPNEADRAHTGAHPGGDIFIHGGCRSIGCIALGDRASEEIYFAALAASERGQRDIPVHVFPTRMTRENLARLARERPEHRTFWASLRPAYRYFERTHRPAIVTVDTDGNYVLAQ